MTFPPRLVSVLVPVQCLLILLGWATCRKLVRFVELVTKEGMWIRHPMPPSVWTAAHLGWMIAVLPLGWGLWATLRADVDGGYVSLRDRDGAVGVSLTVFLLAGVLVSSVKAAVWAMGPVC